MEGTLPGFDALFASLREKVFALALNVTRDRQDAEDATQETFLAVHRALPSFRGESQPSTWVFRIALRAALQVRARRARAPQPDGGAEDPGSDQDERALLARDEARRLIAAMDRLSGEQRAVLALFAVDGLSHREAADVLGVPEGTVWSRLHTARKKLQEALADPTSRRTPRAA